MVQIQNPTRLASEPLNQKMMSHLHQVLERQDIGFWQMPDRTQLWQQAAERATSLRQFSLDLIVIGIGGSSLGARTLCSALIPSETKSRIHFVDHIDELRLRELSQKIKNPAWLVVSKSGSTMETLAAASWFESVLGAGTFHSKNTVVVTEEKPSALANWAAHQNLPRAEIPEDVGGRFSVLTAAGLIPYLFAGGDAAGLSAGAKSVRDELGLWAEIGAQIVTSWQKKERLTFFWSYAPRLETFTFWMQQLWAESLGKQKNRKGETAPDVSLPVSLVGPRDQHSILQLLMAGQTQAFTIFLRDQSLSKFKIKSPRSLSRRQFHF